MCSSYAWDAAFNPSVSPYDNVDVQRLCFLLYAGTTKIGCAMTDNCLSGRNVLYCKLHPYLATKSWPFG